METLAPLPKSWSELTWQQLVECWQVKIRYGGNPDVARAAALLALLGLKDYKVNGANGAHETYDPVTGEKLYYLSAISHQPSAIFSTTPRELSHLAKTSLGWFDFPYGDPGEKEERDEKGKVIKEARDPVRGYVSNMHDAMILPLERFKVQGSRFSSQWFALPQAACANLTWEQYRALQALAPQLFASGQSEEAVTDLQAQFLAHILVPRSFALFDTTGGNIKVRPHWVYQYDSRRAEGLVPKFRQQLSTVNSQLPTLFHICFQVYQTALSYYNVVYPLLFAGTGKNDPLQDALTGEMETLNSVMKYQGYSSPQEVYDANLPLIFATLNNMAKEAKEIEKINAKSKRRR